MSDAIRSWNALRPEVRREIEVQAKQVKSHQNAEVAATAHAWAAERLASRAGDSFSAITDALTGGTAGLGQTYAERRLAKVLMRIGAPSPGR